MLFLVQTALLRLLLGDRIGLPETTRQPLAREVVEENARFVASNAETGTSGRVTARKVDGSIVLNGTKTFNTGSGGARYAHVTHVLEGDTPAWFALIALASSFITIGIRWDSAPRRARRLPIRMSSCPMAGIMPSREACRGHFSCSRC